MEITISGMPSSQMRKLAEDLSRRLRYRIADDGDITISDDDWVNHPHSYSIFCCAKIEDAEDFINYDTLKNHMLFDHVIDIEDMRNYDLVVDTSQYDLDTIMPTVERCYKERLRGALLCGSHCQPTLPAPENVQLYKALCIIGRPVVYYYAGNWYIVDGHKRMFANPRYPVLCDVKFTKFTPVETATKSWLEVL